METFSALLASCAENSSVTSEFPEQRPVTWSFDVFFDLRQNQQLSKQWRHWWFEPPWRSLWHYCNGAHDCRHCRAFGMIAWRCGGKWFCLTVTVDSDMCGSIVRYISFARMQSWDLHFRDKDIRFVGSIRYQHNPTKTAYANIQSWHRLFW